MKLSIEFSSTKSEASNKAPIYELAASIDILLLKISNCIRNSIRSPLFSKSNIAFIKSFLCAVKTRNCSKSDLVISTLSKDS